MSRILRGGPFRTVTVVVWSVLVWVALWSDLSLANVLLGLLAGVVTLVVLPLPADRQRLVVRPWPLLVYLGHFLADLVVSAVVVAWEIVTPGSRLSQGVVRIPLRATAPGVVTLIANSISLTPGTLTIEVEHDPPVLYVHVLQLQSIEQARADIAALEDRILAAFPNAVGPDRGAPS